MEIKYLNTEELKNSLEIKDLSDSTNGIHSINLILEQIKLSLKSKYDLEPIVIRNSPIVNTSDNYDKLYYPKNDITKSSRYTRWVDETHILRTHTTSGVPKLLQNQVEDDLFIFYLA